MTNDKTRIELRTEDGINQNRIFKIIEKGDEESILLVSYIDRSRIEITKETDKRYIITVKDDE